MKKKIAVVLIHAFVLVAIHIVYFNMDITMPHETDLMGMLGKAQRFYSNTSTVKDSSYVFVNTAYDNTWVSVEDDKGDSLTYAITNRAILAKFLGWLKKYGKHTYVLCDMKFDLASPDDSLLQVQINDFPNIIFPEHSELKGKDREIIFNRRTAIADYATFEGKIAKLRLYGNGKKTLPLQMYEDIHKQSFSSNSAGLWLNGSYTPHTIYPRYYFTGEEVQEKEQHLGKAVELLSITNGAAYHDLFEGKIIVIGNFNSDLHLTPTGKLIPGSVILLDTYLTLSANTGSHNWWWFLFTFISFCFISYLAVYFLHHLKEKTFKQRLLRVFGVPGLCVVLSLLSFALFSVYTTIIPVILYFEALHFLPWLFGWGKHESKQHPPVRQPVFKLLRFKQKI